MKKLIIAVLLFSGAIALADVVGSVTAIESVAGTGPTGMPVTATAGIPLQVKLRPIQYVNVTVQPVWDGGQGFQITAAALRAWKFNPMSTCVFDGGSGCIQNFDGGYAFAWARQTDLDVAYTTDSGTPYVTSGPGGISFSRAVTAPTFNNSRLYYQVETLTAADAGTLAIGRVLLEGVY